MKISIEDFFSKCDQFRRFLHFKFQNFIFCAVNMSKHEDSLVIITVWQGKYYLLIK